MTLAVATSATLPAAPVFETPEAVERTWGARDYRLDLGGWRHVTEDWSWPGWNGYACALTNGSLAVTGRWSLKHGALDLWSGATLKFASAKGARPAAVFNPGAGDAAPRRTVVHAGATLDLNGAVLDAFNGSIEVEAGGVLKLSPKEAAYLWTGTFPVTVAGRLEMPRGFALSRGNKGCVRFVLEEGSRVAVGGDVSHGGCGTKLEVEVRGGELAVAEDCTWEVTRGVVAAGATWRVAVAEGKVCDLSAFACEPGAKIVNAGQGTLILSRDDPAWARFRTRLALAALDFTVEGDAANRCYFISFPDRFTNVVRRVTYRCPDDDAVTTRLPYFHRRYPDNGGRPFTVVAEVEAKDGARLVRELPVAFNPHPIGKPAPNEEIFVGTVSYGPGRERFEMTTNDLGNLYVRWQSWPQLTAAEAGADWMRAAEAKGVRAMTIYASAPGDAREELKREWGARYLGNNIGEYTGFLYGHRKEMKGPQGHGQTLSDSREWFVSRFIRPRARFVRGAKGEEPFFFATSGAAFAAYEMEGGVDFVCNELYAVGCANLTYAQSEARGAARRWGPEWLCGWLAHEWQTFGIPYESDEKYLSLEVGMKSLYLIGTSLMCLESGSSGTQAHPHTAGARREGYGYDDEPCRRYRETLRKVYRWIQAHPRDAGTPETRIALALGGGDSYIGQTREDIAPWGQHTNRIDHLAETPNPWGGSDPERNWEMTREVFFPACGTPGVSATPYGQVDVVVVDDQSRARDLARYRLLVFGGWNTMTERARRVLLDWVTKGGTLALAKPQLTTRDDRDFVNYTDKDLLPLATGRGETVAPGIVRWRVGKGEIYLSTARAFPATDPTLRAEWTRLLRRLAVRVPQRLTLAPATGRADETRFFAFAVYRTKAYILNLDMHTPRTVRLDFAGGKSEVVTLNPLEVQVREVRP